MTELRVHVGVVEDCRHLVLTALSELPAYQRMRLASEVTRVIRDAGLLPGAVEQHYSATQAAALLGRCPEFVVAQVRLGKISPACRDDGGWIIPASAIQRWLDSHAFGVPEKSSSPGAKKRGVGAGEFPHKGAVGLGIVGPARAGTARIGGPDCADAGSNGNGAICWGNGGRLEDDAGGDAGKAIPG